MTLSAVRSFEKLDFRDPKPFLARLRVFELDVAQSATPRKIRTLRTNALKESREMREAAIFCYLMGQRIGHTVYVASGERQDYDFVAMWDDGQVRNYAPVQLKEVVPKHLNGEATLAQVVSSLAKYADSKDLVVAVHLNQQLSFDPVEVVVPPLCIGGLWMFGAVSPDHSRWGLWGDFLRGQGGTLHEYPDA